eukprot:EG_transcript_4397
MGSDPPEPSDSPWDDPPVTPEATIPTAPASNSPSPTPGSRSPRASSSRSPSPRPNGSPSPRPASSSLSPSPASPSSGPSASHSPSPSPSPSPSASPGPLSLASDDPYRDAVFGPYRALSVNPVGSLTTAQRQVLAAVCTHTTTLWYSDGLVAYVQTNSTPRFNLSLAGEAAQVLVAFWGDNTTTAVVSSASPSTVNLSVFGLSTPTSMADRPLLFLGQVERFAESGAMTSNHSMTLVVGYNGTTPPTLFLFSSAAGAGELVPASAWQPSAGPGPWTVTVPHTSVLALYDGSNTASPSPSPPGNSSSSDTALLGLLALLVLPLLALLMWCAWWRTRRQPAEATFADPVKAPDVEAGRPAVQKVRSPRKATPQPPDAPAAKPLAEETGNPLVAVVVEEPANPLPSIPSLRGRQAMDADSKDPSAISSSKFFPIAPADGSHGLHLDVPHLQLPASAKGPEQSSSPTPRSFPTSPGPGDNNLKGPAGLSDTPENGRHDAEDPFLTARRQLAFMPDVPRIMVAEAEAEDVGREDSPSSAIPSPRHDSLELSVQDLPSSQQIEDRLQGPLDLARPALAAPFNVQKLALEDSLGDDEVAYRSGNGWHAPEAPEADP